LELGRDGIERGKNKQTNKQKEKKIKEKKLQKHSLLLGRIRSVSLKSIQNVLS
jgi:hypothetical protein